MKDQRYKKNSIGFMSLNLKEEILDQTNFGFDIYDFILKKYNITIKKNHNKNIKNPFYNDHKPSLKIYFDSKDRKYKHKDFGNSPNGEIYQGDAFNFAGNYYGISDSQNFYELLKTICEELNLKILIIDKKIQNSYLVKKRNDQLFENIYIKDFSENELNFWKSYGIDQNTLNDFNVKSINSYKINNKVYKSSESHPFFAYCFLEYCKIYRPFNSEYKFFYYPRGSKLNIFGLNQCDSNFKHMIIVGGKKDVMTLYSLDFNAICLNSETAEMSEDLYKTFKDKYENIFVLYDNDDTGIRQSKILANKFKIKEIHLPEEIKSYGCKDISDYAKLCLEKNNNDFNIDILRNYIFSEMYKEQSNFTLSKSELLVNSLDENLPDFFKKLMSKFSNDRQKDIILLSSITVLGSIMNNIKINYGNLWNFPFIYTIILGRAATGKSAMTKSILLLKQFENYFKVKSQEKNDKIHVFPADVSKAGFIELFKENNSVGIMFDTEIDTYVSSNNQEWGNTTDILRKIFGHETISKYRKKEKGINESSYIIIENPKLSILFSGTFNQLKKILPNNVDGLFSRFIIYYNNDEDKFEDQFSEIDIDKEFISLSNDVLNFYKKIENKNIIFNLSSFNRKKFVKEFDFIYRKYLILSNNDFAADVKRMATTAMRVMMIFEIVRIHEKNIEITDKIQISDEIVTLTFNFIKTLIDMKYEISKTYPKNNDLEIDLTKQESSNLEKFLNNLPNTFSRHQVIEIGKNYNLNNKMIDNLLYKKSIFKQIEKNVYKLDKY